jgi:geranylgeranyl diphosphate synthase type II
MDLELYLKERRGWIDAALEARLPGPGERPGTLHRAMLHSIFAGGKRLRPILCLAAAEACGADPGIALDLAVALECLHTYTLIHDDLPCMDDDDFRRGHPTCHKVFGDGIAVLAGDALQALAFEICGEREDGGVYARELAVTSGSRHLVGGQVLDLEGESKQLSLEELRFVHLSKTAALLTTSVRFGGRAAGASEAQLEALTRFGQASGLAFQVIDDILDVTQTTEKLGKSAGKDVDSSKSTYPALLGLEASREEAHRLTREALEALAIFGDAGSALRALGNYLLERDY